MYVDPFFPAGSETADDAILKMCLHCTVTTECKLRGDEIGAVHGVWGGERRTPGAKDKNDSTDD